MRDWLVEIRKTAKATQQEVADLTGTSQSAYASIEVGSRNPSVAMAKRIAEVLGFEWTRFYENDHDESA